MQVRQISNPGSLGLVAPLEPRVSGDPQGQPGDKPGSLSYALARAGGRSRMTGPVLQVWSQLQHWRGESRTFQCEKGSTLGSILAA